LKDIISPVECGIFDLNYTV